MFNSGAIIKVGRLIFQRRSRQTPNIDPGGPSAHQQITQFPDGGAGGHYIIHQAKVLPVHRCIELKGTPDVSQSLFAGLPLLVWRVSVATQ